jgi:AbrB family looped-hinge helix DNA binding protein
MKELKISSKGQVVIPKYLRDSLGFSSGIAVVMYKHDNKLIIMKRPDDPLASLATESSKLAMKNIRRDIKPE